MQIILRFKSRLHIQYIVHGFCSIIHWLLFTLFCHISFHRKKIHYPLYQRWWMFSGLYDMGEDGGEQLYILFQWMPHYQALGSNEKKRKRSFSNTHMHTDCILIILFPVCMSFFLCRSLASKSWHRSSNKPKAQKAHIHIQLTCFTYSSRILQSVSLLLKSWFQMHCQHPGSTCNWCRIKHKKFCT